MPEFVSDVVATDKARRWPGRVGRPGLTHQPHRRASEDEAAPIVIGISPAGPAAEAEGLSVAEGEKLNLNVLSRFYSLFCDYSHNFCKAPFLRWRRMIKWLSLPATPSYADLLPSRLKT